MEKKMEKQKKALESDPAIEAHEGIRVLFEQRDIEARVL